MRAYRVETTVERDGELALRHLPIKAGETVEVLVLTQERMGNKSKTKLKNGASQPATSKSARRLRALNEIRSGLFAKLRKPGEMLPSEQFILHKQEEIELEERRFR